MHAQLASCGLAGRREGAEGVEMIVFTDRRDGRRIRRRRAWLRTTWLAVAVGGLLAASVGPAIATGNAATAINDRVKAIVLFDAKPGQAATRAVEQFGGKVRKGLGLVNGLAIDLPRGQLKALARAPHVKSVELDARITAIDAPVSATSTGDLEYDNAWGVTHIGSKVVHDAGIWGQGVKVAIIDTGIDYIHNDPVDVPYVVDPEFSSNYRGGYDFVNNDSDPFDDNGHGTHVAGILAAEKNGYLVVGVAPRVDLYALKILDANGEGDISNLILALQWAVANGINVVNMSLGTHEVSPALAAAVSTASSDGLIMVAASGNTVTFTEIFFGCPVTYPGAYPEVLSTTFTNENDALTGYSCTGPEVDFAAPGNDIFSPVPVGTCMLCSPLGYAAESGTSMASPHLAGTVALMLSAGLSDQGSPGLLDDVRNRLCSTTDVGFGVQTDFGTSTPIPPSDPRYPLYFGCGVIRADRAVLGITPPPVNHAPVAVDDAATTVEDTPVSIPVKSNDSDPDGDSIFVSNVGTPTSGTAALDQSGTAVLYTPAPNANGSASFGYTLSDGHGGTDTATVAVTITPVEDPPLAVDDTTSTNEDSPVDVAVLDNDSDPDGDTLSVNSVGAAVNGTPTINANGTVRFVPSSDAVGDASFEYTVSDGHGGTDIGAVHVTIYAVNDPPVAANDSGTTAQGSAVILNVLANDTDIDSATLTVASVSDPPHGTAVANSNGTITYTPDASYGGPDAFGYTATDGSAVSNVATVSITVTPAPPPNPFHVADLDRSTSITGKTWIAKVTIRIENASNLAIGGAVVTGAWSTGATASATCTTASNGTCSVQIAKLARASVASVTFTVTNVTRSGGTYMPSANHDPDGDSTGTVIVIARPN
jgi:subtilisin family serine protease